MLEGAIKWINILKRCGGKNRPPVWNVVFGMLDSVPISHHQEVSAKTIRERSFLLFVKVVDVNWQSKDYNTGLASVLSSDETVAGLLKNIGNLKVCSYDSGWAINLDRKYFPNRDNWGDY